MAQDRSRGARHQRSRQREDYGWGVPIRGMYSYSLDYGSLGGPETDSESIPGYDTGPGDWLGPGPDSEQRHRAARERPYGSERCGRRDRPPSTWHEGTREPSGREHSRGGEWWPRERSRSEAGWRPHAEDRGDRPPAFEREHGYRPAGDRGRGAERSWPPRHEQAPHWRDRAAGGPGRERSGAQQLRWPEWRGGFREELGGMTPAYGTDPYWRRSGYAREYEAGRPHRTPFGSDYRPAVDRQRYDRDLHDRGSVARGVPYGAAYGQRALRRWEEEWERDRGRGFHGHPDFEAYDRQFRRAGPFQGSSGRSRPRSG